MPWREPTRHPLKRNKDRKQGAALLDAVVEAMPHYPIDATFADSLPPELKPHFDAWQKGRSDLN